MRLIIFIHGLNSSRDSMWKHLRAKIEDAHDKRSMDRLPPDIATYYYEYSTSLLELKKPQNNSQEEEWSAIKKEAFAFDTSITSEFETYDEIYIVAHSKGALIATQYLLNALDDNGTYRGKVKKFLLVGAPLEGSLLADIVSKVWKSSQEVRGLTTNNKDLEKIRKNLPLVFQQIHCLLCCGTKDKVIKKYTQEYPHARFLDGGHTNMFKEKKLERNFPFLREWMVSDPDSEFQRLIKNNPLPVTASRWIRPVEKYEIRSRLVHNEMLNVKLLGKKTTVEHEQYRTMLEHVGHHSLNPHEPYPGKKLFIPVESNARRLDTFWENIVKKESIMPFFYYGPRGSGKTLQQNIWISEHFEEMEQHGVFHVRCDVHKIYEKLLLEKARNITIHEYLDMQMLYIFLKYRNKTFNTKGPDGCGVTGKLMSEIEEKILQSSTIETDWKTLGIHRKNLTGFQDFFNVQSENLRYWERLNSAPSYMIFLLTNAQLEEHTNFKDMEHSFEEKTKEYLQGQKTTVEYLYDADIQPFWRGPTSEEDVSVVLNEIETISNAHAQYKIETRIHEIKNKFEQIREDFEPKKKTAVKAWMAVSRYMQQKLLEYGYTMLKIIDGIDNIVIHDTNIEKTFYEEKLKEIRELHNTSNTYYWVTLREDTFNDLGIPPAKTTYRSSSDCDTGNRRPHMSSFEHGLLDVTQMNSLIKERLKMLRYAEKEPTTLYLEILQEMFGDCADISGKDDELKLFDYNVRELLRHRAYLSLHVFHELHKNGNTQVDVVDIVKTAKKQYREVLFLRDRGIVYTGAEINDTPEDKDKAFPNPFYFIPPTDASAPWKGFCIVRILQMLQSTPSGTTLEQVSDTLAVLYGKDYIEKVIEEILKKYNLIHTKKGDAGMITLGYFISEKGNTLLECVRSRPSILYYLCFDTPLPDFYVSNRLLMSHNANTALEEDQSGYPMATIKTLTTFASFLQKIHNAELTKINAGIAQPAWFIFPVDLTCVENYLENLYCNHVETKKTEIDQHLQEIGGEIFGKNLVEVWGKKREIKNIQRNVTIQ